MVELYIQFISEPIQQPQALQPLVAQPLAFSTDINYEQLAVWLTNYPQFVGIDYQQDISKLKSIIIIIVYCTV